MQGDDNKPVHGNTASADVGRLQERALADNKVGQPGQSETFYRQIQYPLFGNVHFSC